MQLRHQEHPQPSWVSGAHTCKADRSICIHRRPSRQEFRPYRGLGGRPAPAFRSSSWSLLVHGVVSVAGPPHVFPAPAAGERGPSTAAGRTMLASQACSREGVLGAAWMPRSPCGRGMGQLHHNSPDFFRISFYHGTIVPFVTFRIRGVPWYEYMYMYLDVP